MLHDSPQLDPGTGNRILPGVSNCLGAISQTVGGPTQFDETQQVCSGFKGQEPPRDGFDRGGSSEGGRTRWMGNQGDEVTLVTAGRDVLRVMSAQEGSDYEDDLGPVIEEADDLSQRLGEV